MITPQSILEAVDARRDAIAAARGYAMPYSEVADAMELHSALFSRLRRPGATLPSAETIDKLAAWLGGPEALHCATCPDDAAAVASTPATALDSDTDDAGDDDGENVSRETSPVFAIQAVSGRLSDSDDPETQAAVNRVRELLTEGAVGVSVMLDLHPDDAAVLGAAEKAAEADEWSKPFRDYLPSPEWEPRQRVRHTAIVDTPAYSDARLSIDDAGLLSGPVTYEGIYTGDVRYAASPENIDLESSRVPSPIIWDRSEGDHSGMTVGYIDGFERVAVDGDVSGRPVLDDEAITASVAPLTMPAAYFAQTVPTHAEPLRISQPDAKGYRVIRGLAAPKGVCHRSAMACFTFPDDPDPRLSHFHTGTLLRLDDGKDIRVGAITYAGHHLDPALAKAGVTIDQADNYRDDANRVLALVRAWPTRFGLMVAGVIPPDVTEADITRVLACSPSVELWPRQDGRRTLFGIHVVPRPAWPVMASVGSATVAVSGEPILLDETPHDDGNDDGGGESVGVIDVEFNAEGFDALAANVAKVSTQLTELREVADAILALIPIDGIEIPAE